MFSHGGGQEGIKVLPSTWSSFKRILIPFMKVEPLWLNHLPKATLLNMVALGIKFLHEFRRGHLLSDHSSTVLDL